jgi:hypothetical protein
MELYTPISSHEALFNAFNDARKAGDSSVVAQYLSELRELATVHDEPAIREPLAKALFNHSISLDESKSTTLAYSTCMEAWKLLAQLTNIDANLRDNLAIRINRLRNKLSKSEVDEASDGQATRQPDEQLALRTRMITSLEDVINELEAVKIRFLTQMKKGKQRVKYFLNRESRFKSDASVCMVLPQWNSYTPIIVDGLESDRGGGYFLRHHDVGLVIDPGYNFIELFHKAGCKIVDITHVAITHAHDDHTAQLEQLMSMFHQYNRQNKDTPKKVTLLLNHSTMKKFSGFNLHGNCLHIDKVICLNAFDRHNEQTVTLAPNNQMSLTVLPAYHDDIFSMDYAIGLGLSIHCGQDERRIVFSGDTGLYPLERDEEGEPKEYTYTDNGHQIKERRVVEEEQKAIYKNYPEKFQYGVDLLIPHLGSIKEYEFNPRPDTRIQTNSPKINAQEGNVDTENNMRPMFYPNHLGILGTTMLIKELQPTAVILSEFGAELRGLRVEITELLSKALEKNKGEKDVPFIIPGDPGIVYNISDGTFLCHEDSKFYSPATLKPFTVENDRIGLFNRDGSCATMQHFDKRLQRLLNTEQEDYEQAPPPYFKQL